MSKCKILIVVLFFLLMIIPQNSKAQNSHEGFTFTIGTPGIGGFDHDAQDDGIHFALAGHLRFGYGLTEQIILFFENFGEFGPMTTSMDRTGSIATAFSIGTQYFILPNHGHFLTPTVGFAITNVFNEDLSGDDKDGTGFTVGIGYGHEWRVGKTLAISPEGRFDYFRTGGSNAYFYGLIVNFQFY